MTLQWHVSATTPQSHTRSEPIASLAWPTWLPLSQGPVRRLSTHVLQIVTLSLCVCRQASPWGQCQNRHGTLFFDRQHNASSRRCQAWTADHFLAYGRSARTRSVSYRWITVRADGRAACSCRGLYLKALAVAMCRTLCDKQAPKYVFQPQACRLCDRPTSYQSRSGLSDHSTVAGMITSLPSLRSLWRPKGCVSERGKLITTLVSTQPRLVGLLQLLLRSRFV